MQRRSIGALLAAALTLAAGAAQAAWGPLPGRASAPGVHVTIGLTTTFLHTTEPSQSAPFTVTVQGSITIMAEASRDGFDFQFNKTDGRIDPNGVVLSAPNFLDQTQGLLDLKVALSSEASGGPGVDLAYLRELQQFAFGSTHAKEFSLQGGEGPG
ncbi:hypothetical protein [Sabulicella rubraurantiaca]|uniref:hypothetical protein n=1 Tax=Sabulicella rubraurantiaca TaxID=2811429 RepID=UPI001A9777C0|nr:hypothetical protein [Sabulicella rubraurantiaca]